MHQEPADAGASNATSDVEGSRIEDRTGAGPSPKMSPRPVATKRPLHKDSSFEELKTYELKMLSAPSADTNPGISNKRLKSGSSSDTAPETPTTPTTPPSLHSSITSSNVIDSSANKTKTTTQSDTNYSIATEYGTADQPPPTPPPSAASTATNSSNVPSSDSATPAFDRQEERPESAKSDAPVVATSPRKTSVSSFDSGNGWTDDEAYERMPKTPVAPPQKPTARRFSRQSIMSPIPGASGVYLPDVPPAPPTTPAARQTGVLSFGADLGLATPLPYTAGFVQNANQLEQLQRQSEKDLKQQQQEKLQYQLEQQQKHELHEGAETPAPPRPQKEQQTNRAKPPSARSTTLSDDFSEWAVGDRYKLSRMLGRGSYGEVAQAIDLYQGRPDAYVAIKRIVGPFDQEVDAVRLFREIHILRRLRTLGKNDCIVPLLDVVQPPTEDLNDFHDLYLVFDYVDTDLYKLIMSPQYLTTEHIQTFLYQMLIGLKYIHSGNVIHRDLKPANILLNEDCSLKVRRNPSYLEGKLRRTEYYCKEYSLTSFFSELFDEFSTP